MLNRKVEMKRIYLLQLVFCSLFFIFPVEASALLGFDFDINSSVSTSYDDNITFVKDDKISDNVTNLKVGLGAKQEGKTYQLNIEGSITQKLFAKDSSFNNNSQDINVKFQKEFSKYDRVSMTNKFVHAENPRNFEDDFGRTPGRYSYYRNTFNTAYTRDLSKYVSVEGRYRNRIYNASREDIRDSLDHRVGFDVNYLKSSATTFLLGYDFITRHIDGSDSSNVHTLSTGFKHFLTKQLYMDTRTGVSFVETTDGSNTSKPNIIVVLTNDFSETDSASLSYRQTSRPSSYQADIFDSWRVAVNLKRQLLERLGMTVSIFFGEGEFEARSINDTKIGVSTRVNYDVRKDMVAFLAYTYSEVDSNIDTRSYDRNLIEVGVRMTF